MSESLVFKAAATAVEERRQLLKDLRLGLSLLLLALALQLESTGAWLGLALLLLLLWRFQYEKLLAAYAGRELRFQDNTLELIRGRFTRLLFFDQLEQLRMIQGPGEKVLALELRTLDGAVSLSGYENMEALFGALSARKPARVMVEVEEKRWDSGSPRFWARLAYAVGSIVLLLWWLLR